MVNEYHLKGKRGTCTMIVNPPEYDYPIVFLSTKSDNGGSRLLRYACKGRELILKFKENKGRCVLKTSEYPKKKKLRGRV